MKQYTLTQAAAEFGTPAKTLRSWINKGLMKCERIGPRTTMITREQYDNRKAPAPMGRKGWKKESLKKWDNICTRS